MPDEKEEAPCGGTGLRVGELSISFHAPRDGPSPLLDRVLSHEARGLSLYAHGARLFRGARPHGV